MSERPVLYWMPESPPCRTIYAVAKVLEIDLNYKLVRLDKKEQMEPEFIKLNPFHTVPTFVDSDGFVLWESRAISKYLIQKYKSNSALYPANDLKKRALIDRCLDWDLGTLYRANSDVIYSVFQTGVPNLEKLPRLNELFEVFENYLKQNDYQYLAGGNEPSLADISTYFNLKLSALVKEIDFSKHQYLSGWFQRIEEFIKSIDTDGELAKAQENIILYAGQIAAAASANKSQ